MFTRYMGCGKLYRRLISVYGGVSGQGIGSSTKPVVKLYHFGFLEDLYLRFDDLSFPLHGLLIGKSFFVWSRAVVVVGPGTGRVYL